jgi:hypothetical protein
MLLITIFFIDIVVWLGKIKGQSSLSYFKITIDSTTNDQSGVSFPILNIAEVSFFFNSIQIANNLFTFTSSSYLDPLVPLLANDNDIDTFFHSNPDFDYHPYLNMTVSDSYPFNKIEITNRIDCCPDRIVGAHITVYHTKDTVCKLLWYTTITTSESSYTFSGLILNG